MNNNKFTDTLISIYNNSPNIESLYKLLIDEYKLSYLSLTYDNNYSPLVYENGKYTYKSKTLYMGKTKHFEMAVMMYDYIDMNDNISIIDSTTEFIINSFINKLVNFHLITKEKNKKESILNNFSHSLKIGLTTILNTTNLISLSNKIIHDTDIGLEIKTLNEEHIQILNDSTIKLANNLMDIIDLGYLELGKLKIVNEVFNFRSLISNTIKEIKNVIIKYDVDDSVPEYMYGDQKRLKQLLLLLLPKYNNIIIYISSCMITSDESINKNENTYYGASSTRSILLTNTYNSCYKYNISFEIIQDKYTHHIHSDLEEHLIRLFDGKFIDDNLNITLFEEEPLVIDSNTLKILKNKSIMLISKQNHNKLYDVLNQYSMKWTKCDTYDEFNLLYKDKVYDLFIVDDNKVYDDKVHDKTYDKTHDKAYDKNYEIIKNNVLLIDSPSRILNDGCSCINLEDSDDIKNKIIKLFYTLI